MKVLYSYSRVCLLFFLGFSAGVEGSEAKLSGNLLARDLNDEQLKCIALVIGEKQDKRWIVHILQRHGRAAYDSYLSTFHHPKGRGNLQSYFCWDLQNDTVENCQNMLKYVVENGNVTVNYDNPQRFEIIAEVTTLIGFYSTDPNSIGCGKNV